MIGSYIKVAFRNIFRNRTYSAINIAGMTIGIACTVLIMLWVYDELSYDRYNEKADRICRIAVNAIVRGEEFNTIFSSAPMAETLLRDFPEVEAVTRMNNPGFPVMRYKDKAFSEEKWYNADSTYFKVFTAVFLKGDSRTALTKPNSVVITRSTAEKYFGDEDPMGKVMNMDKRVDYIVTGVVEDIPRNTHLHWDFLGSLATDTFRPRNSEWLSHNFYTYVLLREGASFKDFEKKLEGLVEKYVGPETEELLGMTLEQYRASGGKYLFLVQPLTWIHLNSHYSYEVEPNGSMAYVYIFSLVAGAILLIACINFLNLATARGVYRAKEVGIRKTIGSTRTDIMKQFIVETLLMSAISVVLSAMIIEVALPQFNLLVGKNLKPDFFLTPLGFFTLLGVTLFAGLAAGAYPAYFISSFSPITAMRREFTGRGTRDWLRKTLVIFQYTVSVILIIGTIVIYLQLSYIQNKDLGFSGDHVVVIKKTDDLQQNYTAFKNDVVKIPGVVGASKSPELMGESLGEEVFKPADRPKDEMTLVKRIFADQDFMKVYDLKLIRGRFHTYNPEDTTLYVVINEAATKAFKFDDPIGKILTSAGGHECRIIGEIKDFHMETFHQKIRPMVLFNMPDQWAGKFTSVRITGDSYSEVVDLISTIWKKYADNQAFEYEFFDDRFERLFLPEGKTGETILIFSLLSIFVASMGLYGLASLITVRRTKEIGVRKIVGASTTSIVFTLSKEFMKWVLIANAIGWPIAYYLVKGWLENFAYRIGFGEYVWVFPLAAITSIIIAFITISQQTIRAASANPVKSLKYE